MDKDTVFCIECCKQVTYYTAPRVREDTLTDGRKIEYEITEAYCDECNEPVYVDEIVDRNIAARWDALFNAFEK